MSERITPARLVPEGTRRPRHQPVYTVAARRFACDCECGWKASNKDTIGQAQHAFGVHLVERALRRQPRETLREEAA